MRARPECPETKGRGTGGEQPTRCVRRAGAAAWRAFRSVVFFPYRCTPPLLRSNDDETIERCPEERGKKRRARRFGGSSKAVAAIASIATILLVLWLLLVAFRPSDGKVVLAAEAFAGGPVKYSTRLVRTRYGALRGIVTRDNELEAYLGVPYATPPLGALRYTPPVTPSQWRGVRHADSMPPSCPQNVRNGDDGGDGLLRNIPANGHVAPTPVLVERSEDCLYLNLYVPRSGNTTELLPALLLVHGGTYSSGTGNSLVGTALATHGRLVVASINFRLGILGFLKTGPKGSGQGNYGLMDLVAGLYWLRENLQAFGGDPERLSVLGHGTGAALANFLAVSPMARELIERVVLLGGSALSPWALQRDPLAVKRRVAEQTGCPLDVERDDVAACLRLRSLEQLLEVRLESPRFTSGFAPFVDGTVLPFSSVAEPTAGPGGLPAELASFGDRRILMGLTTDEAWLDLSEEDIRNGLNETRRDRILRTYVRNTYRYHLREIYSTLRNEYTDWERGEQQTPSEILEGLLGLLGDGQVAAPLIRLALVHSSRGARTYFMHFQPGERPSHRGDELPYILGVPILRNEATDSPAIVPLTGNYTRADESLSRLLVRYLANFVWRGDPNDSGAGSPPFWDAYDSINQYYLEASGAAGESTKMRSHYRGHKMSLWLNLLPQLHRPGYETSTRHHHLAENPSLYEGAVRPQQTMAVPISAPPLSAPSPTEAATLPSSAAGVSTTECAPNENGGSGVATTPFLSTRTTDDRETRDSNNLGPGPDNLLRKFASNHYQSYTTALTVTIAVGIFLLLLNILIFAGIYHQRDRNVAAASAATSSIAASAVLASPGSSTAAAIFRDDGKEDSLQVGCSGLDLACSAKSLLTYDGIGGASPINKKKLPLRQLELEEFQCSPPPGGARSVVKRISSGGIDPPSYGWSTDDPPRTPSPCVDVAAGNNAEEDDDDNQDDDEDEDVPDPPPPPKVPAPNVTACPGILRQPGTPGSAKKRVQIQEISV